MITLLLLAAFTATFVTIDASSGCVESKLIKGNTVKGRFTLTDTIEECLEHCRQVDGCVAINYNTKKRCNPKKRLLKDTDQTNSLWTYCPIDEPEPEIQVLPVEPEPEIQVLPPAPGFTLISEESRGICTSCPHLGGGAVTGGVEGCKKLCRDTANCNAFNYKNDVCYTKKCLANCDIKPTTSQGGWNVWLAKELNCEPITDDEKDDGGEGDLGFELISPESTGTATSCPHLGGGAVSGGLEGCKKLCRDTTNCNAFNYKNNVCYTKQCAADCDIKPYTTHGGWNVYMDTKLNCADKQEPEVDDRKTGGDCLTDGLIYLSKDSTDIVAELRGVASALECQNLCRKQTTCDYGTSAVSGFCTPKEGLCTHLYYSSTETHCMMFQSHPTEVDMSMMPKGWYLAGTVYC